MLAPFEHNTDENPYSIHADLPQSMQTLVGIFRTEQDLQSALEQIEQLRERTQRLSISGTRMFNPGWHLCADLKSMLTVVEAVTRRAVARKESRGGPSRIYFPYYDSGWGNQNNIFSK